SSSLPNITKLNSTNYNTWADEVKAWLCSQNVWCIVDGLSTCLLTVLDAWQIKLDKAAGYIFLLVEDNQKIHLKAISDDPVKM
ncbi:hypothetical protein BDN70DRAFT_821508, partial [Pholiota conissans]